MLLFSLLTWLPNLILQPATMQRKGLVPTCLVTWVWSQVKEVAAWPCTLQPPHRHWYRPAEPDTAFWGRVCTLCRDNCYIRSTYIVLVRAYTYHQMLQ